MAGVVRELRLRPNQLVAARVVRVPVDWGDGFVGGLARLNEPCRLSARERSVSGAVDG